MERHGFDALSFVFGAALAALGVLLISGVGEVLVTGSWLGPVAAILIGIALLVVAPRPRRSEDVSTDEANSAA